MADQIPPNKTSASDEIDLGQLFELIHKGIKGVGNFFLRIFIYLRRNAIKLGGLVVLGLLIGFGLNKIISKKFKTEVIVKPNFESKDYLYDVIDELASNIKSKNEDYFKEVGISVEDLEGFGVEVLPINEEEVKTAEAAANEVKYLEVLQKFKDESFVIDIIRSELSDKSVLNHKIIFTYKEVKKGQEVVRKLMNYINTNEYFDSVKSVYTENAKLRIEKNSLLIDQIDKLVDNYSKALLAVKEKSGTGMIYMEKENTLNVPSLLSFKDKLSKEIEDKRLEIAKQNGLLSVLNFGKAQEVNKSFFNKPKLFIPVFLVVGYLLLSFFKYLERKAKEIE